MTCASGSKHRTASSLGLAKSKDAFCVIASWDPRTKRRHLPVMLFGSA